MGAAAGGFGGEEAFKAFQDLLAQYSPAKATPEPDAPSAAAVNGIRAMLSR